jgi:hypothetical protein
MSKLFLHKQIFLQNQPHFVNLKEFFLQNQPNSINQKRDFSTKFSKSKGHAFGCRFFFWLKAYLFNR